MKCVKAKTPPGQADSGGHRRKADLPGETVRERSAEPAGTPLTSCTFDTQCIAINARAMPMPMAKAPRKLQSQTQSTYTNLEGASVHQGSLTMGSSARQVTAGCQAWLCKVTPCGLSGGTPALRKRAQPAFAPVRARTPFLQQVPFPGLSVSNGVNRVLRLVGRREFACLTARAGRDRPSSYGAPEGDGQSHQGSTPDDGAKKGSTRRGIASPLSEVIDSICVVKPCTHCQRSKPLIDFEKTVTTLDGRTNDCRACLAVIRAKRARKALHHMALSVEESWERAKPCTKCGLVKEFRDFSRHAKGKDGTYGHCRACQSTLMLTRRQLVAHKPTEEPQRCRACLEVKEADKFFPDAGRLTGRQSLCIDCHCKEKVEIYKRVKEAPVHVWKATRRCGTCQQEKPRSSFYKRPLSIDGLTDKCIACKKIYDKSRAKVKRREHQDG